MRYLTLLLIHFLPAALIAQMPTSSDTLYGNEWVRYDQPWIKAGVTHDGIHRLQVQDLLDAGLWSTPPAGAHLQLWHNGEEVPLYVSNDGPLTAADYIEFCGSKNRGELDAFIYIQPDYQLNPAYSLFNDTSAWFLTWADDLQPARFAQADATPPADVPAPAPWCLVERVVEWHNTWTWGRAWNPDQGFDCHYDLGEGYGKSGLTAESQFSLSFAGMAAEGPGPQLWLRLLLDAGNHELQLTLADGTPLADTTLSGWQVLDWAVPLPSGLSANATFKLRSLGDGDRHILAMARYRYAHQLDAGGEGQFRFLLPAGDAFRYLEIGNVPDAGTPVLYDLTEGVRYVVAKESDVVRAWLPPAAETRELLLCMSEAVFAPASLAPRVFEDYGADSIEYAIISHPALSDDGTGYNPLQAYADYRSSPEGGGYKARVIDVTQLYDQFGWGIDGHEQAIRNFIFWAHRHRGLRFVFLVGKGAIYTARRGGQVAWPSLVPSFGHPTSDNLFATTGNDNTPIVPVGRLAVTTPAQVSAYLAKVQQMEAAMRLSPQSLARRAWMKRLIQLGGGDVTLQSLIRSELNALRRIAADSRMGANVVSFFKNSTEPVQVAYSEQLRQLINEGTGVITFFGHSSPTTFDFSLGHPDDYDNAGRYPLLYAIGCHTNRYAENPYTIAEEFTLASQRGVIAFIGASWVTTLSNLSSYARYFYDHLFHTDYGATIGEALQRTSEAFGQQNLSFFGRQLRQVVVLHGDPALRIYPAPGPDYVIDPTSMASVPALPNTYTTTLDLQFDLYNLGTHTADSLVLQVVHEQPSGEQGAPQVFLLEGPAFRQTQHVAVALGLDLEPGTHRLYLTLDPLGQVDEKPFPEARTNNTLSWSFQVVSQDVFPAWPMDRAIVQEAPSLLAVTPDGLTPAQQYHFQIDTTATFDSPLLHTALVETAGNVVAWEPPLPWLEGAVYYWRVSIDSALTQGQGFLWRTSSFLYAPDLPEGWNESHLHQWQQGKLHNMRWTDEGRLAFLQDAKPIRVVNPAWGFSVSQPIGVYVNNDQITWYLWNIKGGVNFVVFDSLSVDPWINIAEAPGQGMYGSAIDQYSGSFGAFSYDTRTPAGREKAIHFLQNVVPEGNYVLVYTTQQHSSSWWPNVHYEPEEWAQDTATLGTSLIELFEAEGAQLLEQAIGNPRPWVFFFKKGHPEFDGKVEVLADSANQVLETEFVVEGVWDEGTLLTEAFGPARSWQSLDWQLDEVEAHDEADLTVIGIRPDGSETMLLQNLPTGDTSISQIDARQFPRLALRYHARDEVLRTPPQPRYWRLSGTPAPDFAVAPDLRFAFTADTLQQGQPAAFELGVRNLTPVAGDSLAVRFRIVNGDGNIVDTIRIERPLSGNDTLHLHYALSTASLSGLCRLLVELNPERRQPEITTANNLFILPFFVQADPWNPLVDVTFDGRYIMDGDIVSAEPLVRIALRDENRYLPLRDTSLVRLLLTTPSGQTRRLYFDSPELQFFPADNALDGGRNEAVIEWEPRFAEDGEYVLQLRARDVSGNPVSDEDMRIRFRVITRAMISHVLNYPNPFTTATRFVFTLTGSEPPADLRIQIFTVGGQIVREIDLTELGPLHIGLNQTDFAWDGTDQYGDRLARGVYLYRVVARKPDGSEYELLDDGMDGFFRNGFGKMVLLR